MRNHRRRAGVRRRRRGSGPTKNLLRQTFASPRPHVWPPCLANAGCDGVGRRSAPSFMTIGSGFRRRGVPPRLRGPRRPDLLVAMDVCPRGGADAGGGAHWSRPYSRSPATARCPRTALRQAQHPLGGQCFQTVLDQLHRALVPEATGQTGRHPEPPAHLPQPQHADVRRQPTAVEPALHPTAAKTYKCQLGRDTL